MLNQSRKSCVNQPPVSMLIFYLPTPPDSGGENRITNFSRLRAKNSPPAFNAALSAVYGALSFALVTRRGKITRRKKLFWNMNASQIFDGIPPWPGRPPARIKRKAKVVNRKKVRIHIWLHCHSPVCTKTNFMPVSNFCCCVRWKKKPSNALSIQVCGIKWLLPLGQTQSTILLMS